MSMKNKLFNQCVLPTMTYACETWATTKRMDNKLRVTQRAMEHLMAGVTKKGPYQKHRIEEENQSRRHHTKNEKEQVEMGRPHCKTNP